jgi:hypothetical protein
VSLSRIRVLHTAVSASGTLHCMFTLFSIVALVLSAACRIGD